MDVEWAVPSGAGRERLPWPRYRLCIVTTSTGYAVKFLFISLESAEFVARPEHDVKLFAASRRGRRLGSAFASRHRGPFEPQSLVDKNVVNGVEVEKHLIIKKIEQREMDLITQEKINQETSTSRPRISTRTKLLM